MRLGACDKLCGYGGYRHAYSVVRHLLTACLSHTSVSGDSLQAQGDAAVPIPVWRDREALWTPDGALSTAASRAFLESSRVPVLSAAQPRPPPKNLEPLSATVPYDFKPPTLRTPEAVSFLPPLRMMPMSQSFEAAATLPIRRRLYARVSKCHLASEPPCRSRGASSALRLPSTPPRLVRRGICPLCPRPARRSGRLGASSGTDQTFIQVRSASVASSEHGVQMS